MTNTMTVISETALGKIKGNKKTMGLLAIHFEKHYNTIENWINNRSWMLTTPDAVRIISEETGLTQDQILEEEPLKVG